ncbi:MAG TPA: OmpA family protein [Kofleriaceae bacterium]|jgi:outer membrane protein OmpA-like peptidoglycan-associated protein|nr:OmpA family protein [Kofleriaceae bacterium]
MNLSKLALAAALLIPALASAEPRRISKAIEFDYGKARIYSKQREGLKEIAKQCVAHPEMTVRVEGHAGAYNEEDSIMLGQFRADVVRGLLIKYGVKPANITAIDDSREGEAGRYVDLVLEVR